MKPLDQNNEEPEFTNAFVGLPPGSLITPETATDAQIEAFASWLFPQFEAGWERDLKRLRQQAAEAAAIGDDAMRTALRPVKAICATISSWVDRAGEHATEKMRELLRDYGKAADDISAALNSPLPGQGDDGDNPPDNDPSEAWKGEP